MSNRKILYFEGAGWPYEESDVGNHRIQVAFKNLDGVSYCLELGDYVRYVNRKSYKELPGPRGTFIIHCYRIVDGERQREIGRDYHRIASTVDYTKEHITRWINANLNCDFDTIEVLDDLADYRVHDKGIHFIEDFKVDLDLFSRRRKAFDGTNMEYRKALNAKYKIIRVLEMDEATITIECYASDQQMEKTTLPRVKTITV